jgi:hypothetical protein
MPDFQLLTPKSKTDYIEDRGYFRKSKSSFYIDLATAYLSGTYSWLKPHSQPLQLAWLGSVLEMTVLLEVIEYRLVKHLHSGLRHKATVLRDC